MSYLVWSNMILLPCFSRKNGSSLYLRIFFSKAVLFITFAVWTEEKAPPPAPDIVPHQSRLHCERVHPVNFRVRNIGSKLFLHFPIDLQILTHTVNIEAVEPFEGIKSKLFDAVMKFQLAQYIFALLFKYRSGFARCICEKKQKV